MTAILILLGVLVVGVLAAWAWLAHSDVSTLTLEDRLDFWTTRDPRGPR